MGKIRVQPAITENNIAGIINVNQRLLDEENQPKFGSIGLRQEVLLFRGNFVTVEKRVGYLNGTLSDLERVVDEYNLRPDEEIPDSFNKKLVIQESLEKSWETQNPKINPTTGEVLTYMGHPIYRRCLVVDKDSPEEDVYIIADNTVAGRSLHQNELSQNEIDQQFGSRETKTVLNSL